MSATTDSTDVGQGLENRAVRARGYRRARLEGRRKRLAGVASRWDRPADRTGLAKPVCRTDCGSSLQWVMLPPPTLRVSVTIEEVGETCQGSRLDPYLAKLDHQIARYSDSVTSMVWSVAGVKPKLGRECASRLETVSVDSIEVVSSRTRTVPMTDWS